LIVLVIRRSSRSTPGREYRGGLGIAPSDVCGMAAFLRDFDFSCKLFDGVRHDSAVIL
jgi:nicotinic acid phosphoribosyltransferase